MSLLDRLPMWPSWRRQSASQTASVLDGSAVSFLAHFVVHVGLVLALTAMLGASSPAQAREGLADTAEVALSALPPEAQTTYSHILAGGPFRSSKDGSVFGNREHLLPPGRRGYYHEYTVRTPGVHDRGARRLVCGGLAPTTPDVCYYTDDHYASYRRVTR